MGHLIKPRGAFNRIKNKKMLLRDNYKYTNITSATTTQVYTGQAMLVRIVVNTTAAGTIKVIDDVTGTTANIATLKASVVENSYEFGVLCATGIRIVTGAASDITVVWSPITG